MSRKITSLMVLLAAVLLTLPAQAQTLVKAKRSPLASNFVARDFQKGNVLTSAFVKARKNYVAKYDPAQQAVAEKQFADAQKWAETPWYEWADQAKNTLRLPLSTRRIATSANALLESNARVAHGPAKAEAKDSHGIITTPADGETKHYTRAGFAYYPSGQSVYYTEQSGDVEIVETADGTVYIKDIISRYTQNTWVKGTKTGNTITIPTGQPLQYNATYATTLSLRWGNYDASTQNGWNRLDTGDITFTINGDVISLNGSNENLYIGAFWDDDYTFSGYGDYETVWTYNSEYQPASTELVVLPEDATVEDWNKSGNFANSSGTTPFTGQAKVAKVGNDFYLSGLFQNYPNAWIKGTLSGNTVTFSGLQFIGTYNGTYNIFATGTDSSALINFTMTYDAQKQTLTANNDLLANAAEDRIFYLEWIQNLVISKESVVVEEPTATTGSPVEVPYTNCFDTTAEQAELGIIDLNDDGKTWIFGADNVGNATAYYSYSTNANADDWIVTPAVKLEAGKKYHFAIDAAARNATYPERIEVKLGTEPKASALTTQVIPETNINWTTEAYQTLENEEVSVSETGYYHFGIHAISAANQWNLYVDNLLIEASAEKDAPAAVTDLKATATVGLLEATLNFTAPNKTIGGDAITANLAKVDIYRDGKVIASLENVAPGSAQTYVDNADNLTPGLHTYQVVAYNEKGIGQKSNEAEVTLSVILDVPYTANFSKAGVINYFTIIDANNDGKTWNWSAANGAYYSYSSANAANDYLVTSPFRLKAGKNYFVTVEAKGSASYPERLEVVAGKAATASALTESVIAPVDLNTDDEVVSNSAYTVAEDGIYFFAIHAISDADMSRLIVTKFSVEAELEPDAPAAPTLVVTPDPTGEVKADIVITAPSKNIGGTALNKKLSKIDLLRDDEVIATFENVAPSTKLTFTDEDGNLTNGIHTYQAIPYDINGDQAQKSEVVKLFIGSDVPAVVENVTTLDNLTNILFGWDKVGSKGGNGGYVNPAEVDYNIYSIEIESYFGITFPVHDPETPLVTVRDASSAAIDFNTQEGAQDYKYFSIAAANSIGEGEETYIPVFIGKSYELPFYEHFKQSGFDYSSWVYYASDDTEAQYGKEGSDGDDNSFQFIASTADEVDITPGKVTLQGAVNPTLRFDAKGTGVAKVEVEKIDGTIVEVGSQTLAGEDFQTIVVSLKDFVNEAYILPHIAFELPEGASVLVDNVIIADLLEYDLSVAIDASKSIQAGDTGEYTITVKNEGENAISNYTVTLTIGDEEVYNEIIAEELGSLKTKTITGELNTSIFDDAADLTLKAEVAYELDLNEENNTAEALTTIVEPAVAGPTNVVASEIADNGVVMYWTAPEVDEAGEGEQVTEDFKSYDNGANDTGLVGDWTLVNNNGFTKGGIFTNLALANDGKALAYEVIKPTEYTISNSAFNGPQGTLNEAYLISAYNYIEATDSYVDNDDWLISPELAGIAQTITFSAQAFSLDYGPSAYEVLASSTDKEIASFTKVAEATLTTTGWQTASAELPAGTKYFAIRNVTDKDAAMIFGIGDISYLVGGGEAAQVAAYNVYVDGELFATVEGDKTTYTVPEGTVSPGEHQFAVSAVYDNGKESKPVTVDIVTTGIDQIVAGGKAVDVYTLDGKLVRSKTTDFSGLKGIFVVGGKAVILK